MSEKAKTILKKSAVVLYDILALVATICLFKYLSWPMLLLVLFFFICMLSAGLITGFMVGATSKLIEKEEIQEFLKEVMKDSATTITEKTVIETIRKKKPSTSKTEKEIPNS